MILNAVVGADAELKDYDSVLRLIAIFSLRNGQLNVYTNVKKRD
jgi:hypothetical protein